MTGDRKFTFEEQQELNRIRDSAMGTACEGLTTTELKELKPSLLRQAPGMYEACKEVLERLDDGLILNIDKTEMQEILTKAIAGVDDVLPTK